MVFYAFLLHMRNYELRNGVLLYSSRLSWNKYVAYLDQIWSELTSVLMFCVAFSHWVPPGRPKHMEI